MIVKNKVTEIFCVADGFCKIYDRFIKANGLAPPKRDKGYISRDQFGKLLLDGIQLVTELRSSTNGALTGIVGRLMLHKRAIIETIDDELKRWHESSTSGTGSQARKTGLAPRLITSILRFLLPKASGAPGIVVAERPDVCAHMDVVRFPHHFSHPRRDRQLSKICRPTPKQVYGIVFLLFLLPI